MKGFRSIRVCLFSAVFLYAAGAGIVSAQVEARIDTREKRDVVLYRGDVVELQVFSLTRVAISAPGIVDIFRAEENELVLVGLELGQTQIFIWDEYGKRSILARVIEHELDIIQERISQLLNAAGITGIKMENSSYEAKIIATGKINKSQKKVFDRIIEDFKDHLINMVDSQGDLIQIDSQITELNMTLEKTLGVEWLGSFGMKESSGPTPGITDMFRIVNMDRMDLITATVNALLISGEATTLSRPSIVVSDGDTANISVGGEVPIVSAVVSDGIVTETTEFKEYGLQFSVTPEIRDNEKVDILLSISILDLDPSEPGAFLTTETTTRVLLDDGQTIIIAGLIKRIEGVQEQKVPFLSSIPILGMAFRYKKYTKSPDKEIVISLTPHIRRQKDRLKTIREVEEDRLLKDREAVQKRFMEEPLTDIRATGERAFSGSLLEKELDALLKDSEGKPADGFADGGEGAGTSMDLDAILRDIEKTAMQEAALKYSPDVAAVITEYARGIQSRIAEKISFPYDAKEAGWEGVATLSLKILSNGELNDVSIEKSSGHNIFDRDAMNTAYIVAPYQPFPIELEMTELTVLIPVSYSQQAFFGE